MCLVARVELGNRKDMFLRAFFVCPYLCRSASPIRYLLGSSKWGTPKKAHCDQLTQEALVPAAIGDESAQARRGFRHRLSESKWAQADREDCAGYLETSEKQNRRSYER